MSASLHVVRVDARCRFVEDALSRLLLTRVVDVLDVEGMDMSREVAKDRQSDVDEEIRAAACYTIDADGWD
jgi:hypothetical protein